MLAPPSALSFAVAALAAFGASALFVLALRTYARNRSLLDRPNQRSAHSIPTPRLGGLGIMATFLPGAAIWSIAGRSEEALVVIGGAAAMAVLGLLDDLRSLPARTRFAVQVIAAAAVVWARREALTNGATALLPLPVWILGPLAVLWIVWMTNLYNFMDGIDGLAAGQGVFASLGLAAGALAAGSLGPAFLLVLLAAAIGGFLLFNFPPASIFMGDVGSTAIGFFLACVPFLPSFRPVPVEAVAIAAGLFIFDATTTLIRRMRKGEHWYEPHRSHWYQRPLSHGVPHRAITLWAYAGMLLLGGASAVFVEAGAIPRLVLLSAPILVFLASVRAVLRIERAPVTPERAREVA
jgi:Fuc2NAc and GlcNAc transferase